MVKNYEFYKIRDYDSSVYTKFYQNRAYPKLREEVKDILVYSVSPGLGDLVISTSFFKTLKSAFPEAKLWFLGKIHSRLKTLFEAIPDIDGYLPYSITHGIKGAADYCHLRKAYKNRRFDLLIDTQRQFIPSLVVSRIIWARYKIGYSSWCFFSDWKFSEPNRDNVHIIAQLMLLLRVLGIEECSFEPEIEVIGKYSTEAKSYLEDCKAGESLIGIIPGAANRSKCWPANFFAEVGDRLSDRYNSRIVLFGGEDEKDILSNVAELMRTNPLAPILDSHLFLDDLMYSAALMKRCSFIIGNDCGGVHLATTVGVPVIVVYGPTQPTKFGPLGNRNVVINHRLRCSPCSKRACPIDRRCLKEIEPEEAIGAAEFLMAEVGR